MAARALKKAVPELGSNAVCLALEDAHIDIAVKHSVMGRLYNNGETCISAKRFIVTDKVHHAFVDAFVARMKAITMGSPTDENSRLGPPSSQARVDWTNSHLYEFRIRDIGYGVPDGSFDDPIDARKETLLAAIEDIGARSFKYLYDFGDGWTHTVKIDKIFPATAGFDDPFLLEVVGRCAPEDVGGLWGYEEFREAIADTNHERHHEILEWWGDVHYDPGDVDAANLSKNVEA